MCAANVSIGFAHCVGGLSALRDPGFALLRSGADKLRAVYIVSFAVLMWPVGSIFFPKTECGLWLEWGRAVFLIRLYHV